ncbi:MAG TPA: GNAT family protein, partial [Acholeplasmataceae bacterium]|nr:GNAT family protein [Acholeplasmataceae bacterium]
ILKDDLPIGYIRIDYMDNKNRYAWLRFALGLYRGHGYMKEALLIKLNHLKHQHVHRIECEVYDYNLPSIHVLESLGFVREGIKRKAHAAQESYHDIYVYGLLFNDIEEGNI